MNVNVVEPGEERRRRVGVFGWSRAQAARRAEQAAARAARAGERGWPGRGGGSATYLEAPAEYRGTTVQVCGLWPFSAGASTPMVGVPIGRHLDTGATVCCDPISWFQRAKWISNPSMFVFSNPGLGKSSLIGRMMIGLAGFGSIPMVLGDVKPDHVKAMRRLGGKVIEVGHGRGYLNVLDASAAHDAAQRLREQAALLGEEGERAREAGDHLAADRAEGRAQHSLKLAGEIVADARARRKAVVSSLLAIARNGPVTGREETIIERALKLLDEHFDGIPVLHDLLDLLREGPAELRQVAVDRGVRERYDAIIEPLEADLVGLTSGGRLGEIFSRQTSDPIESHRGVVFDISSIDDSEPELRAATLLACWSVGFGTINIAHALAEAGLAPQRHYFVVMDELWQALALGHGIVGRIDALTRLNRKWGVGIVYVSHTMSDLLRMADEHERSIARGLVARCGMVVLGGLDEEEMPQLTKSVPMTLEEQRLVQSWQVPPSWASKQTKQTVPPGVGNFLIKVKGRIGVPVHTVLTPVERDELYNTSELWDSQSSAAA